MFKTFIKLSYYQRMPITLGRWKLNYEEQQINKCILWVNEDNCGCCDIEKLIFDEDGAEHMT